MSSANPKVSDDIREIATRILVERTGYRAFWMAELIEAAILAERERCAKIAESATRNGEIITAAAFIAMRIRGEAF